MSKFTFPPMIQQLRAANAGQIALADSGTHLIGKLVEAIVTSLVTMFVSVFSTESLGTTAILPNESPTIGVVEYDEIEQEGLSSISFTSTETLEPLTAMPTEAPVMSAVAIIVSVT